MYKIMITYDTGDSFHQENGVKKYVEEVSWKNVDEAEKSLKDIEEHYQYYMMMHKEWNAGKEDKEKDLRKAKRSKWAYLDPYSLSYEKKNKIPSELSMTVENDDGERIPISCFWCGCFESLVGGDVISEENDKRSFRI